MIRVVGDATKGEVPMLHLVCEECDALGPGHPNDAAPTVAQHPAKYAAMALGWVLRMLGNEATFVCTECVAKEKKEKVGNAMAFGDTFKQPIKIKLTEPQKAERKDRLVTVEQEIDRVKSEKRGAVVSFNDELKEFNKERKELLVAITTGTEEKEVEVYQRVDERRGEVLTVRCDTQEIVAELTRPLTAEERQLTLDDARPNGKPEKPPRGKGKAAADEDAGDQKPAAKPKGRARRAKAAGADA